MNTEKTNEFKIGTAAGVVAGVALIYVGTKRVGMKVVNWNERRKIDFVDTEV